MNGAATWQGKVNEDGSYSVLARITALQGSGQIVNQQEGACLKQADVAGITAKVFDLGNDGDATTGTEVMPAPTLAVANNILDTLQTLGWPIDRDYAGYNFRHDLGVIYTPEADRWYRLEYKLMLNGGGVIWLRVKVRSIGLITS